MAHCFDYSQPFNCKIDRDNPFMIIFILTDRLFLFFVGLVRKIQSHFESKSKIAIQSLQVMTRTCILTVLIYQIPKREIEITALFAYYII